MGTCAVALSVAAGEHPHSISCRMSLLPEELDLLLPNSLEDSLLGDIDILPPNLQVEAQKMKQAQKAQLKRTASVYHVNEQMDVLSRFVQEAHENDANAPILKSVCHEIMTLLNIWAAFRLDTHETFYYRWHFRDQSIKEIRCLKSFLRNQVKVAFKLDHLSPFAEELKYLLTAINEMQAHVMDLPFEGPPDKSQCETLDDLDERQSRNGLFRL
jgi:hypothetical protein